MKKVRLPFTNCLRIYAALHALSSFWDSVAWRALKLPFLHTMVKVSTMFVWLCIAMLFIESCHSWWDRRRRRRRPPSPSPPCADCRVSGWSSWGGCSYPCGNGGVQWRSRHVTISQNHCGSCSYHMRESKRCNIGLCANYGRPHSSGCYCRLGYTGTCCKAGEFLVCLSFFSELNVKTSWFVLNLSVNFPLTKEKSLSAWNCESAMSD